MPLWPLRSFAHRIFGALLLVAVVAVGILVPVGWMATHQILTKALPTQTALLTMQAAVLDRHGHDAAGVVQKFFELGICFVPRFEQIIAHKAGEGFKEARLNIAKLGCVHDRR